MKSFSILQTRAPYSGFEGIEALDMSMLLANFDIPVQLFVCDDGVLQLLKSQQPEAIGHKNFSKTFGALSFYDIESIIVDTDSLTARGISPSDLLDDTEVLDSSAFQLKLLAQDYVVSF